MTNGPVIRTMYVPLPADLWAQAAHLTMRPMVVREQASAMLVRVALTAAEMAQDSEGAMETFDALPAEKQAWVLGLVRKVLTRFGDTSR